MPGIVVNMTSIPTRFGHLQSVVNNLREHAMIDEIIIHIPKKYDNPMFEYTEVPDIQGAIINLVDVDYGPARRYIYAQGETIVVVDDDTWYDPRISEVLISKHLQDTTKCWGGSGFKFTKYFQGNFSKIPGEQVDVIEGYGMIVLPFKAIESMRDELKVLSKYNTSDDIILNNLLQKYGYTRWFYNENNLVKQLEYGFKEDALHRQNPEGSHSENYKRVLQSLRKTKKLYFRPVISYAICVCDEHQELSTLLKFLMRTIIHCDEIVVLVDETRCTPLVFGVLYEHQKFIRVFRRSFDGDFAAHKNFLNSKCRGTYIFNIDADEVPGELLMKNVHQLVDTGSDVVHIPRVNIVIGHTTGPVFHQQNDSCFSNWPDYQSRIYKNDPDRIKWEGNLHEKLIGAEKTISVNPVPLCSILHVKTYERCIKQAEHYDALSQLGAH